MDLEEDFKEFLALLIANDVRFLIVGGFALATHGLPRATDDLDVWVWMDKDNAHALKNALDYFGFSSLDSAVSNSKRRGNGASSRPWTVSTFRSSEKPTLLPTNGRLVGRRTWST